MSGVGAICVWQKILGLQPKLGRNVSGYSRPWRTRSELTLCPNRVDLGTLGFRTCGEWPV